MLEDDKDHDRNLIPSDIDSNNENSKKNINVNNSLSRKNDLEEEQESQFMNNLKKTFLNIGNKKNEKKKDELDNIDNINLINNIQDDISDSISIASSDLEDPEIIKGKALLKFK